MCAAQPGDIRATKLRGNPHDPGRALEPGDRHGASPLATCRGVVDTLRLVHPTWLSENQKPEARN